MPRPSESGCKISREEKAEEVEELKKKLEELEQDGKKKLEEKAEVAVELVKKLEEKAEEVEELKKKVEELEQDGKKNGCGGGMWGSCYKGLYIVA